MRLFGMNISRAKPEKATLSEDSEEKKEMVAWKTRMKRLEQQMELKERELEHKMRVMEMEDRIFEMEEQIYGGEEPSADESGVDGMIMKVLESAMTKKAPGLAIPQNNSTPQADIPQENPGVHITDEQLKEYWDSLSMFKKAYARRMSDEQISALLKGQVPNISEDSIARAIKLIRT